MTATDATIARHTTAQRGTSTKATFSLDKNLGLPVTQMPWNAILSDAGISVDVTADLGRIDHMLADGGPDIAYIPGADFCKMNLLGNAQYRGVLIATSKFTGDSRQRTLLVVRKDDPANSIDDLVGATYGYMNTSCTSSYFPVAILANRRGKKVNDYFDMQVVPGWQSRVDAVVSRTIRATMILEDVWNMTPSNVQNAKIIGDFDGCPPPILIVKSTLERPLVDALSREVLAWKPDWDAVYGAFRPYSNADISPFEHYMSELPQDVLSP
jgi:phosphonate transport system substrate-binding protein